MNAKRNIETRGRTMTTKAIFLLAGKPDKAIKITVKKLKKLGHHIKFCKNIKSLPALDGDDILVVNINNVSEIKRELENRTDAVYIVHDYISCCYTTTANIPVSELPGIFEEVRNKNILKKMNSSENKTFE